MMAKALEEEGIKLVHIIGAKTGHSYHPDAKKEINRRIDSIVALGRISVPESIKFTTWTLRYNKMHWLTIDAMEEHWERARVEAELALPDEIRIKAKNVTALTLTFPSGAFISSKKPTVMLDEDEVDGPALQSDRSWNAHFRKTAKGWEHVDKLDDRTLRKRHGLQGPIDDAFMDSFLMVKPTGKPLNDKVGRWAETEMAHAIEHWRRQFRGD